MKKCTILSFLIVFMFLEGEAQTYPFTLLKDINPTAAAQSNNYQFAHGKLWFTAVESGFNPSLFSSDGTAAGTVVAENPVSMLAPVVTEVPGGVMLFRMGSNRLRFTNGAAASIDTLMPLTNTFAYSIDASHSFKAAGNTFFWADTSGSGTGIELWKTNGTKAGTSLFMDIASGAASSYISDVLPVAITGPSGLSFFLAAGADDTVRVYKTDGTVANTSAIKTLYKKGGVTQGFFSKELVGGKIILMMTGTSYSLHAIDPATGSISQIASSAGLLMRSTAVMNGELYFVDYGGTMTSSTLKATDGSSLRTVAQGMWNYAGSGAIQPNLGANDNKLYFLIHQQIGQDVQLWSSDGTTAGTQKRMDSIVVTGNGTDYFIGCGSKMFWKTAGNSPALYEIDESVPDFTLTTIETGADSPRLEKASGRIYMRHTDASLGDEPHFITPCSATSGIRKAINKIEMKVYPNPSSGTFNIQSPAECRATISDITGRSVAEINLEKGNNIFSRELKAGIYFIHGDSIPTTKIIIQ